MVIRLTPATLHSAELLESPSKSGHYIIDSLTRRRHVSRNVAASLWRVAFHRSETQAPKKPATGINHPLAHASPPH